MKERTPTMPERMGLLEAEPGTLRGLALRALRRLRLYGAIVVAPLAVLGVYYGLICSDGYVGKAELLVQRQQAGVPQLSDLSLLFGSNLSKQDALLISDFMQSRAMLDYLEAKLKVREHYASHDVDWFSRLGSDASAEDFLKYYRKHLDVQVDEDSYVVSFYIEAYSPDFSNAMAQEIVRHAEDFVNGISQKLARDQIDFIQGELTQANDRVRESSGKLIGLQREHSLFSAEAETQTVAQIIAGLEAQLAQARTQLKTLQSYLNDNTAEVIAAKRQITAFETQLEQERSRQVGGTKRGDKSGLNDLMVQYKEAEMSVQLASDVYQTGLKALESARLDASRKVEYLVLVSPPVPPDEAELPHRWRSLAAAFLMLNLAYFVLALIRAAISDHMD